MSQGFRKKSQLQGVSDKTDLTPPTRIDDQRNSRRAQQITLLHQQFQDLKNKIKQVQNKNQKIIEKIHKAYNFKKKNAYTQQYIITGDESPVVYYDNRNDQGYMGTMSVDNKSNKSDQSQKQFKMQKRSTELGSRKALKNDKFNYSMEYGKTDGNIPQAYDPRHTQMTRYSNQIAPNYPPQPNPALSTVSQNRSQRKLVQQLNHQKMSLEQQLSQKENQIYKLQSLLKSNNRNVKGIIQQNLQQFYQNVLQKNISAIEKALKKYELKMKKINLLIKDKQQQKKSSRLLSQGRARRSQSRSRRNSPPRQYTRDSHSKILNNSRTQIKDESRSKSKIGAQQQQKNKKQFQDIANKYEDIIKSKTQQIQKWDKKYRAKQRQCYELKMRVDVLQKRLAQQEKKANKLQNLGQSLEILPKQGKKLSTQSNLLADIDQQEIAAYENEIAKLKLKVQQFQSISNQKSTQISNLQNAISTVQNKNRNLQNEYQQSLGKTKSKYQEQQQKYKRQFEKMLNEKNQQAINYKNSLMVVQKKFLQKQCQYFSLQSKIKKVQGLIQGKDKKIQELQRVLGDNFPTDRSLIMSSNVFSSSDNNADAIRKLKQEIQNLQTKLQANRNQIFTLTKKNTYYKAKTQQLQFSNNEMKKQIQSLHIQNQQLKINVNMNNISAVMKGTQQLDNSKQQDQIVGQSLSVIQQSSKKNNYDLQALNQKITDLVRQKQEWYEKYQKTKTIGLQKQSQNIKIKSQLGFIKKQIQDSQHIINKLKNQNQSYKNQNKQLQRKLLSIQQQFEAQREDFKNQINQIQRKWTQFQEDMKKSGFNMEGERSEKSSVVSYSNRNQTDYISTQNEYLTVKLKQAEAEIQTQKAMQQKIIQQYQAVMQQYKIELKNKGDHIKSLKQQIQDLHSKISNLNMRLEMASRQSLNSPTNNNRKQQKNQLFERLQQLQAQLKQAKQINNKLTDMQGQLFDQIKIKQQQRAQLYQQLRKKDLRIQELEQIVQVKTGQGGNQYGSHMSQSTHKRQSIKSQSSLKYSSHSQILRKSRLLNSKIGNGSQQRVIDLQLSDAGSQFYQQPSQISNISQFFQKEQLPYEKIKIKRQQQIKLFEKTASYIKSLKKAIQEKNKRIKLLEKKIDSLKSSQLVRKQLGLDINLKQDRFQSTNDRLQADDTFKDYESVQLQYRRGGGQLRRYKQLEHDTKLVMEQNNLLIQQIQTLQEQLLKAQEQENSLVKIKDLYKQQIKKLIKKNEEQTKQFQQQLKNQKKRIEESESVHNIQAIKQLFIKIVQIAGLKFGQDIGAKKKQQKRKQLEQYVKVMANILQLNKNSRETVMAAIQK